MRQLFLTEFLVEFRGNMRLLQPPNQNEAINVK